MMLRPSGGTGRALVIHERAGEDDGSRTGTSVGRAGSLEVRWLSRGPLPDGASAWLGPFTEPIEERDDRYLGTTSEELGVKIRGGTQLDVKIFRGSPGELEVSPAIRGRLESWERWSFPIGSASLPPEDAVAWLIVHKRRSRRTFHVSDDRVDERPLRDVELPGCTLELTEVEVDGETWWTLGLEARGEVDSVEPALRATAASLLREPAPSGLHLDPGASTSYATWLARRFMPGAAGAPRSTQRRPPPG